MSVKQKLQWGKFFAAGQSFQVNFNFTIPTL